MAELVADVSRAHRDIRRLVSTTTDKINVNDSNRLKRRVRWERWFIYGAGILRPASGADGTTICRVCAGGSVLVFHVQPFAEVFALVALRVFIVRLRSRLGVRHTNGWLRRDCGRPSGENGRKIRCRRRFRRDFAANRVCSEVENQNEPGERATSTTSRRYFTVPSRHWSQSSGIFPRCREQKRAQRTQGKGDRLDANHREHRHAHVLSRVRGAER
mmetsp:Transcript_5524/g.21616  ORF Transcript_5524/g.21616 Transcript_5524/m.21616 type:complete len:216 (+) Transcript_5524:2051-2698(+)